MTDTPTLRAGALSHRGWSISPPDLCPFWTATGPNYDASYEGPEDGWVDNGEKVEARTYEGLIEEIDAFISDRLSDPASAGDQGSLRPQEAFVPTEQADGAVPVAWRVRNGSWRMFDAENDALAFVERTGRPLKVQPLYSADTIRALEARAIAAEGAMKDAVAQMDPNTNAYQVIEAYFARQALEGERG